MNIPNSSIVVSACSHSFTKPSKYKFITVIKLSFLIGGKSEGLIFLSDKWRSKAVFTLVRKLVVYFY